MNKPESAPGCWGAALAYGAEHEECQLCAFASTCAEASDASLKRLQASLGVKEPAQVARQPMKQKALETPEIVSNEPALTPSGLPKKVVELKARLERDGADIKANPDSLNIPRFLYLILQRLIDNSQTRKSLKDELITRMEWSEGTAASHVGQAIALFKHYDMINDIDGKISLK